MSSHRSAEREPCENEGISTGGEYVHASNSAGEIT